VLAKIAKVNGISSTYRTNFLFQVEYDNFMSSKYDNEDKKEEINVHRVKSLRVHLMDRRLRKNLIILCGCWMASTFSYYMILFYMKYLPGNIFENTIYSSIADTVGYLFTGILF
jgi:hypothetical protein